MGDRPAAQLQLSLASDLELVVPKYFLEEDPVDEERLELLEQIFADDAQNQRANSNAKPKIPTLAQPSKERRANSLTHSMTVLEATQILCKMERARQAVQRAKVLERLKGDEPLKALRDEAMCKMDESTAALTIQRVYKGHRVRHRLQEKAMDELLFLGMRMPNRLPKMQNENDGAENENEENERPEENETEFGDLSLPKFGTAPILRQNEIREKRVNLRIENEVEYERPLPDIRDNVILEQGPKIREYARAQRFDWAIKQRELRGAYPSSFKLFYAEREAMKNGIDLSAVNVVDDEAKAKGKKGKKGKGSKKKGKDKKEKKGKGKDKKDKKGKGKKGKSKGNGEEVGEEEDPFVHLTTPSLIREDVRGVIEKVYSEWRSLDEKDNFAQKHSVDIVKAQVLPSVIAQVELEVDEQLLQALDNLKVQLGIKGGAKKGKKGKGKGKKGAKKGKKGKKSKKKKT